MRLGSMCSGAGMLDAGVARVLDVTHAWFAELDPAASQVLAAHWPEVPNLGDVRQADWSAVEPVDILCAGFPCQPVSAAGQRKGINDERWLFDDIAEAVGRMEPRPRMLVLENVPGLLTANRGHAMARVIRGLAALGYVGRYRVLRASDVGAAHRRERWFCIARLAADTTSPGPQGPRPEPARSGSERGDSTVGELTLLPTPNAAQGRGTGTPSRETAARRMYVEGRRFLDDAVALLPTPTVADARGSRNATAGRGADASSEWSLGWSLSDIAYADRWGEYAPAIRRWELVVGRPAPDPTEPGTKGQPRLSPRFVEWLMGWPDGWVTGFLRRNDALRVLGNGVVPQQAAAALSSLLVREVAA